MKYLPSFLSFTRWLFVFVFVILTLHPAAAKSPTRADRETWVDLETLNAGFVLDLRYATPNNFTKEVLYPVAAAYLRKEPAEALVKVQEELKTKGLGLKIFDAYRPLPVQQKMWDLIQDERYVSNPAVNAGRHTRGIAVDVTLVDASGRELPMPTGYDDFTEKAHSESPDVTPEEKKNRDLLRQVMEKHGFTVYPSEWWHFDFRGWKEFPPSSIPIETLRVKEAAKK